MKIIKVIPLVKNIFKEELTYFSAKNIQKGDVVNIPFRNKNILGLVISSKDSSLMKTDLKNLNFNLRKISEVKEKSIFLNEFLEAIFLTSKYFALAEKNLFGSLIPSVFLENYDKLNTLVKNLNKENLLLDKNIKNEKLLFQNNEEDRISIYKTLIRGSFAKKKSVFIVLPTEKNIQNLEKELSKGIETFTFSLYGNLSPQKQLKIIEKILKTDHPILILGTAPFLSLPRNDYEIIILEKESSNIYKTINKPSFDLRIFVEIYASKIGAKLILADSLLRLETIARKELDDFSELRPLSFRNNFQGNIELISRKEKFTILNEKSIEEIQKSLARKEKVFVFSLRKGLATMTLCKDCGDILMCKKCSAPIVLYLSKNKDKRMFFCNRCRENLDTDSICNTCGSWNLLPLGIGIDTVYEELKKSFPNNNIIQIDKENVRNSKEAEKLLRNFYKDENSILLGTEMALNYIENKISLSVIASFDSLWSIPSFKVGEKIIQLLFNILNKTENKLIIQTKNKDDEAINAILRENLAFFVREEIKDRKNFNYPPFKRFIKITYSGNKEETLKAKEIINHFLAEYEPLIFSGFIAKQKDKYITHALIKRPINKWSLPELSSNSSIEEDLLNKLKNLPEDFSILIDPEDLL
jgi:primosomal protein N' (replication factor Y)